MSIIRVGTSKKYADGWDQAFGGSKSAIRKTAAKASAKKPAAAKKSAKKKAPRAKK
jgi:hypothetical protein